MPQAPDIQGPLFLRGTDGSLMAPADTAAEIVGMTETVERSLRALEGPAPVLSARTLSGSVPAPPTYFGKARGIYHATIAGTFDVTLLYDEDSIRVWQGWSASWGDYAVSGASCLLGPSSRSPFREVSFPATDGPMAPPQWATTPNGVVIIPQRGRAYFFDGRQVAPLGYDRGPQAPTIEGPITITDTAPNALGFVHDGTSGHVELGLGRWGTVEAYPGATGLYDAAGAAQSEAPGYAGRLMPGEFQAGVQWIDRWGNLSPLSTPSAPIQLAPEESHDGAGTYVEIGALKKYLALSGIPLGPSSTLTVGRICMITRDMLHSGSTDLRQIPSAVEGGVYGFATLQDNLCTYLPVNFTPSILGPVPVEPIPVPEFRGAFVAFGRLFIYGMTDGKVRWSMPGRWGTFLPNDFLVPDAGAIPTAGIATSGGVIIATPRSVFKIEPDGGGFKPVSVSSPRGCPAPDTMREMPNGQVVWFGGDDFYAWDGSTITAIGQSQEFYLKRANRARWVQATATVDPKNGEYLCAVACDSETVPATIFVYSPAQRWRRHQGFPVRQFATTQDARQLVLYAGKASGKWRRGSAVSSASATYEGPWVWGQRTNAFDPDARESIVETSWLGVERGAQRGQQRRLLLWLRESDLSALTINVYRDWRMDSVETISVLPYAGDEPPAGGAPPVWGTALWNAPTSKWRRRRPFWRQVHIDLKSSETIKVRISRTNDLPWEFLALTVEGTIMGIDQRVP